MILCIETATNICSVALSDNGKLLGFRESDTEKSHAALLTVFIEELLDKNGISADQLDAVAVSKGPGSYTGLRIGVSGAKGICYGAGIPLIAIDTMESMYHTLMQRFPDLEKASKNTLFCPMIDARRMEVYSSLIGKDGKIIKEVEARIIDADSYNKELGKNKIVFFGNGADKCTDIIVHKNAEFIGDFKLSALGIIKPATGALIYKTFEDSAYFEPFYLKDFIATIPRKNILGT